MDSSNKRNQVVRMHPEIQAFFIFFCITSWLCQTRQKMFGKSMIYTTGQSTWSNDYKIIVYSNLPVVILLWSPVMKSD